MNFWCFMKRIFIIILACLLLLCSCNQEPESFTDITDTSLLKTYYAGEPVSDWRVISALYLETEDIANYSITLLADDSLYSCASNAISCAVLTTLYDAKGYDASVYIPTLQSAVHAPYEVHTFDLCLALMALYACDVEPEMITPAMTHLADIQLTDGGWGKDSEDLKCDPYVSAMVLNVITAYRSDYADDNSRDALLTYLGNCIGNDNTVSDSDGESSSLATMAVLNSLIFAGIPANGEISTALCTAVSNFSAGGTYGEHKDGNHSETATAEVFLAFASARRANIFTFFSEEYKDIINQ